MESEKIWADLRWNQKRSEQIYIGIRKDLSRSTLESEKIWADLHWNQKRSEQIYIGIRNDLSRSTESEKIWADLHWNQKRSEQIYIGIRKDLSRSVLESEKIWAEQLTKRRIADFPVWISYVDVIVCNIPTFFASLNHCHSISNDSLYQVFVW